MMGKVRAGNSEWLVIRNTQYSAAGSVVAVGNGQSLPLPQVYQGINSSQPLSYPNHGLFLGREASHNFSSTIAVRVRHVANFDVSLSVRQTSAMLYNR